MKLENGRAYIGHTSRMTVVLRQSKVIGHWRITILEQVEYGNPASSHEPIKGARSQPGSIPSSHIERYLQWIGFVLANATWIYIEDQCADCTVVDDTVICGGFVYFARRGSDGAVKIGFSKNPERRLLTLGSDLHLMGLYPGTITEEKELHGKFSRSRIEGEWFTCSGKIKDFVNRECCYVGDDFLFLSNPQFLETINENNGSNDLLTT